MNEWIRIPVPVESETDRRQLAAVLVAAGLEVRVVKGKEHPKASFKKFVEYRKGG